MQDVVSLLSGRTIQFTADGATLGDFGSLDGLQIDSNFPPPTTYCTGKTNSLRCILASSRSGNRSASSGESFYLISSPSSTTSPACCSIATAVGV